MRRMVDRLRGSRATVAMLAVVWLSAAATPCTATRAGCQHMAAQPTDQAPHPHRCCVRAAEPAFADTPTSGAPAPAAMAVPHAVAREAAGPARSPDRLVPVTHGPPVYLRLRVLLV